MYICSPGVHLQRDLKSAASAAVLSTCSTRRGEKSALESATFSLTGLKSFSIPSSTQEYSLSDTKERETCLSFCDSCKTILLTTLFEQYLFSLNITTLFMSEVLPESYIELRKISQDSVRLTRQFLSD